VTDVATAVAAYGLPSARSLPSDPLDDATFGALVARCEDHRVLGFLGAAVGDGAFPLESGQRALLEGKLGSWCAHELRVERMLLRALELLTTASIPSRVLKGAALARTAYPEAELRVFGDIDLLVPSTDVERAVAVLSRGLGATRAQPELRAGFDARFGKEMLLRCNGLELDLHRVFVDGALGLTIATDDLFAPPYRFPLAGYELEALPMPQRLLHACYAATLGDWPPRLVSQRDVAQLVLRERPQVTDVLLMARSWQCELVVARAVAGTWRTLDLTVRPPLVEWADRYQPTRRERMLLASHVGPARVFTRHLAAIAVVPGVVDRVAYAAAIAFPQRAYLRARGLTAGGHARRALRRLFG
jgi:hypothetical protein